MENDNNRIFELLDELNLIIACSAINNIKWEDIYFSVSIPHPENGIEYLEGYLPIRQFMPDQKYIIKSKTIRLKGHFGRLDQFDKNDPNKQKMVINSFKFKGKKVFNC